MSEGTSAAELARVIEALLFLSPDPVPAGDLIEALEVSEVQVRNALDLLAEELAPGKRGLVLREVGGGFALATDPVAELPARRLLARPKTPPLTQAQAETLAIVAYLQPVSRPEIARIRGVSSESGVQTLAERGLIEESGRSRFGAVIYRTTELFERLFGLSGLDDLPDVARFDPTPEDAAELRERLLKAGEQRAEGLSSVDLEVLGGELAVGRLGPSVTVPEWAEEGELSVVARTGDELSIVCEAAVIPGEVETSGPWRAFRVSGTLDHSLTGILVALAEPLAEAGVPIFAVSTFDTDYVLVPSERLDDAMAALDAAGHSCR